MFKGYCKSSEIGASIICDSTCVTMSPGKPLRGRSSSSEDVAGHPSLLHKLIILQSEVETRLRRPIGQSAGIAVKTCTNRQLSL